MCDLLVNHAIFAIILDLVSDISKCRFYRVMNAFGSRFQKSFLRIVLKLVHTMYDVYVEMNIEINLE